jgi:ABC-2 type transport system permease protein
VKRPLALEVARWEFLRFFKLRDQLVALATLFVVGLGAYGVRVAVKRSGAGPLRIAVVGPGAAELAGSGAPRFDWRVDPGPPVEELRRQVAQRELDAVLVLDRESAELLVRRPPAWRGELQALLDERQQRRRLAEAGVEAETLEALLAPAPLDVVAVVPAAATRRGGRAAAAIAIGLMLLGVLMGSAYLLVGITGEKQLRITEQVVAAISPQTWIDGKILGLSALTLAVLVLYVGPPALAFELLRRLGADLPALPVAAGDPSFLAALLLFSCLGFLLWFTFFAAIAATVDDPNNSSRGGWLMFPLLPLGLAFAVMRDPDSPFARVLGLLPPTAPTVMPVRLVLTEVAAWEVLAAVAGLVAGIWLLRRTAGRVFRLGMLMYGKEPTWREIWRWARESG